MAKASAQITLHYVIDIKATYRYYLLQSSTLAKPSKPTTNPPTSTWDDTEPTYTEGSTKSLYFVDLTVFSDNTWKYSEVSLSSSYEAAKSAYNKAVNAQNMANNAQSDIDNLEIGGRNLFRNTRNFTEVPYFATGASNYVSGNEDASVPSGYYFSFDVPSSTTVANRGCYFVYRKTIKDLNVLTEGETYTFSFYAKSSKAGVDLLTQALVETQTKVNATYLSLMPLSETWCKYFVTFKWTATTKLTTCFYAQSPAEAATISISSMKLEKGNKATDWTPAPEDIETRVINAETSIESNKEEITLRAKKTEVTEAVNNIIVGGRNYIRNSRGDIKAGLFKNFTTVKDGYGEHTLSSKKSYPTLTVSDGFIIAVRDYEVGKKVAFSYDIMYTVWDFPEGTSLSALWFGQRYGIQQTDSTDNTGVYRRVTSHDMPRVGENGCELNKWFHVEKIIEIPEQAAKGISTEASIQFHNPNADATATITFRLKNVKLEYGNKATDWTPAPEDLETRVTAAEAAIKVNADNISATVTRTTDLEKRATDVEISAEGLKVELTNLEIGGRNLYKGTRDFNSAYWNATTEPYELDNSFMQAVQTSPIFGIGKVPQTLTASQGFNFSDKNKTWTISAMFKGTTDGQRIGVTLDAGRICYNQQEIVNGVWKKLAWTFNGSATLTTFRFESTSTVPISEETPIYIAQVKVEIGNKATDWTPAPEDVDADTANAAKTATNYLNFGSKGLIVGNMTASTLGNNVLIDTDSVDIRNGETILASYRADAVYLGKNSKDAIIDLCNGTARLLNENDDINENWNRLLIEADDSMKMTTSGKFDAITTSTLFDGTVMEMALRLSAGEQWSGRHSLTDGYANMDAIYSLPQYMVHNWLDMNYYGITFGRTRSGDAPSDEEIVLEDGRITLGASYLWLEAEDKIGIKVKGEYFEPYYRAGNEITIEGHFAGYVTGGSKNIWFTVPLDKPIIGNPSVSAVSTQGLILRQNNSYTHGSDAGVPVIPLSYSCSIGPYGVRVTAVMNTTTNATNNAAIGINWSGKITLS